MALHRHGVRTLIDELLIGTGLGLIVLGVGGRVVMRGIAIATDVPVSMNIGGTVTVLASGAAAGAAGALLHALARAAAAWGAGGQAGVRLALFAGLLALVTARGLSGSPSGPAAAFWPLVMIYGVWLVQVLSRRAGRESAADGSSSAIASPG